MWRSTVSYLAIALLVLAACAPGAAPAPGRAPADVQELVIGVPADTWRSEPAERASVAVGYPFGNAPVFEPLTLMDEEFNIKPYLATSWEFVPPNTWRFKLKSGVRFHDGQPFNAEAVKYTMDLIAKRGGGVLAVGPSSTKVVDELTVEITPKSPNRRLVEQLVHPQNAIIAPGTFPGAGTDAKSTPTGTGPFKFVHYEKGNQLVVERFDGYWGEKAKLAKLVFRFMPDDSARLLALRAGDVQAIYDVPREQAKDLESTAGFKVLRSPVGAYDALLVNITGQNPQYRILTDLKVRQAVAYGIDKKTIVDTTWRGNAEVMNTLIPAKVLGNYASQVKGYPFDKAKAAQLLDEAGWKPGAGGIREKDKKKLRLSLVVGGPGPDAQRPMPELVQAQLKQVGIDVNVEVPTDPGVYGTRLGKGEGDLFAEIGNQNEGNPCFLCALFTARPGGFADYAATFGPGPAFDTKFDDAMASVATDDVRKKAAELMHLAVDEVVAAVPIAGIYRIWGFSDRVQGFTPHPSNTQQKWAIVWLAK